MAAGIAGQMVDALSTVGMASGEDAYFAMRSLACSSFDHLRVFDRVFVVFFGDRMNRSWTSVGPRNRDWTIKPQDAGEGEAINEETGSECDRCFGDRAARAIADFAKLTRAESAEIKALIAKMVWSPALVASRRRRAASDGDRPDLAADAARFDRPGVRPPSSRVHDPPDPTKAADLHCRCIRFDGALRGDASLFRPRRPGPARAAGGVRFLDPSDPHHPPAQPPGSGGGHHRGVGSRHRLVDRHQDRRFDRHLQPGVVPPGLPRGAHRPHHLGRLGTGRPRSAGRGDGAAEAFGPPGDLAQSRSPGRANYVPATRGMKAVLPYVDDFLPAANLADLTTVIRLLESIPVHRRSVGVHFDRSQI